MAALEATHTVSGGRNSQNAEARQQQAQRSVAGVRKMISLAEIFVAGLLVANGLAVLNEERFLTKIGWGYEQSRMEPVSVKKQIISLLHAVRLLFTIPLMALNCIVIVLKLILG